MTKHDKEIICAVYNLLKEKEDAEFYGTDSCDMKKITKYRHQKEIIAHLMMSFGFWEDYKGGKIV